MAWSSLASNQMVSFTDAQGGGFTLQSGQSNVTSNQCMTKSDALTKYVLNSSYMSSYASNQLVPKNTWVAGTTSYSFNFSTTSATTPSSACALSYGLTLYSNSSTLSLSTILYTDSGLTTLFNGSSRYWHGESYSCRINTVGIIYIIDPC